MSPILVVDDDEAIQLFLSMTPENEGCNELLKLIGHYL
jgi:CheY-like chemotaxis protein